MAFHSCVKRLWEGNPCEKEKSWDGILVSVVFRNALKMGPPYPNLTTPAAMPATRSRGDQEVDTASLELRVRREDHDPANHALRAAGFAQNMVWVVVENLAGGDGMRDFLNLPVQVHYTDQV
nr:hypothetical protein BHM03_00049499 [Ipomoea batatas]